MITKKDAILLERKSLKNQFLCDRYRNQNEMHQRHNQSSKKIQTHLLNAL